MGLLKNIFWKGGDKNTIVYRFDMKNDYVSKGSILTVEEGQAAVFCHQGKMADVFLPGRYKLNTDNIPILTTLMSWKYGFENPFRSQIYFINMIQFTNQKWGTTNPIIIRDKEFGAVRVRGFGNYAFRVNDPYIFMKELSGTGSSFRTDDICDYLRGVLLMNITDAIAELGKSVLDLSSNLLEMAKGIKTNLQDAFKEYGVRLTAFNIENLSLPAELEATLDRTAGNEMMRKTMDVEMQRAQAEALKTAAGNQGNGTMGGGIGMGMGLGMGQMFAGMLGQNYNKPQDNFKQDNANAGVKSDTKFCSECGAKNIRNAKFCSECGKRF
ncbi:MAG: SPFH domain-containing protein [Christensenellaceae bacterium]|jgi:membrane protease subunit (stomatin/prohibitin family)|nr:SPFH domain-containing protein [Christensenellaceae bacterium]